MPLALTLPVAFRVLRSKTVTELSLPLLVKPLPSSGTTAIPWTPGRVGQLADDLLLVEVDDDHAVAPRDVEPSRVGVDREVIPAALAADGDLVDLRRGPVGPGLGGRGEGGQGEQGDCDHGC